MLLVFGLLSCYSAFILAANGHGIMCSPRQRGAYKSSKCGYDLPNPANPPIDFCAHCLNGGGVHTVRHNLPSQGWEMYNPTKLFRTTRRAGLCGDPKRNEAHMIGGAFMPFETVPVVDVYKQGAEIDFVAEIDTNHNGYFEFHLCDLDKCQKSDIHRKCFRKGACYKLLRVPHPHCEDTSIPTEYECGPIDKNYPSRWYLPCRNTGHVGVHIVGGESGTMRYKLPENVTCKHCIVQWYWATANSCNPPGVENYFINYKYPFGKECESDAGGKGAHAPWLQECDGDRLPEEFWSCADVQITKDGKSIGLVTANQTALETGITAAADGVMAKEDPLSLTKIGQNELAKCVDDASKKSFQERQYEVKLSRSGKCFIESEPCDATVPCCDENMVCVYTIKSGGFSCRYWWILFEEVNDQHEKRKTHGLL